MELWSVLSFGPFFFVWSWRICYLKGQSLRCSPGRDNAGGCAVTLYGGEGPRGSNGACSTLHQVWVTPSATYNQIGPLWCWFLSGWACVHSRTLWVSPMSSPVSRRVSPPAASVPSRVFNQRFEALFPCTGALGCAVCFAPCCSSQFIYVRMWGHGVCYPPRCLPRSLPLWVRPSLFICVQM